NHTLTETQVNFTQGTYAFDSGSGTNCTFTGSTATAAIASGTTPTNATCTFNNRPPTLTVIKHVINDNASTGVASDFAMLVTGTNPSPPSFPGAETGTVVVLKPGSYSVAETGPGN